MALLRLSPSLPPQTCLTAYAPFKPSNSEQRLPPLSYRGCWHRVSRGLFAGYHPLFSPVKEVYNPKAFFLHAASLRQGFPHCAKFPTAASRRSLGRVSVPVWPTVLSDRLPVFGLVGIYPANYLIGRRPIPRRLDFHRSLFPHIFRYVVLSGISPPFEGLSPSRGQVTYVLLTRAPLGNPDQQADRNTPSDLHVLSTPPAFVLSQDQTLS